jgi:hypothetical protein
MTKRKWTKLSKAEWVEKQTMFKRLIPRKQLSEADIVKMARNPETKELIPFLKGVNRPLVQRIEVARALEDKGLLDRWQRLKVNKLMRSPTIASMENFVRNASSKDLMQYIAKINPVLGETLKTVKEIVTYTDTQAIYEDKINGLRKRGVSEKSEEYVAAEEAIKLIEDRIERLTGEKLPGLIEKEKQYRTRTRL